jgi:DNA topoisomerase-1
VKETREGRERKYRELILKKDVIEKKEPIEITGAEKNKLFPTNMAMLVNDFLVSNFSNVVDFSFTANVEKEFDDIAQGKIQWDKMIDSFYSKFHSEVEVSEQLEKSTVNASRELGKDPVSGKEVLVRMGRFGPIVQIGGNGEDEEEKPRYASLRKGQFIENITLDDAMELFKLPRKLGEFEDIEIEANVGRFGPYVKHSNKFYSLPKEDDPHDVSLERAIQIIEEKRLADSQKLIKEFKEEENVQVLNGRWGPYIKFGKKNVKIPKDKVPEDLTFEECKELADKTPEKFKKKKK